jgi:hypothetical protein
MFGVGAIDSKAKRRSVFGPALPSIHHVGDERGVAHHRGEIAFMIIACHGANVG